MILVFPRYPYDDLFFVMFDLNCAIKKIFFFLCVRPRPAKNFYMHLSNTNLERRQLVLLHVQRGEHARSELVDMGGDVGPEQRVALVERVGHVECVERVDVRQLVEPILELGPELQLNIAERAEHDELVPRNGIHVMIARHIQELVRLANGVAIDRLKHRPKQRTQPRKSTKMKMAKNTL